MHAPLARSQIELGHSLSDSQPRHARSSGSHVGNGFMHCESSTQPTHAPSVVEQRGIDGYAVQSRSPTQPPHTSSSGVQRGASGVHALGPLHAWQTLSTQYGSAGFVHSSADAHGRSAGSFAFEQAASVSSATRDTPETMRMSGESSATRSRAVP